MSNLKKIIGILAFLLFLNGATFAQEPDLLNDADQGLEGDDLDTYDQEDVEDTNVEVNEGEEVDSGLNNNERRDRRTEEGEGIGSEGRRENFGARGGGRRR
jgi:hypothetical protein